MAYRSPIRGDRKRVEAGSVHVVSGRDGYRHDPDLESPDLEPTERCWKNLDTGGVCNGPSDDASETGLCTKHLAQLRSRWTEAER
jgi:hypothetical protein